VGGTGDIKFTHQELADRSHMVTASVSPGLMETETSMSQRLVIFSSQFAAQTCPKGYDFVNNPGTDQPVPGGLAQRTKTYVFRCR
jgi:hypothetical protein